MGCGVRKSGSPISRWITSMPRASHSRASVWICMTSNGSMCAMRAASRSREDRSFMAPRLSQVLVPEFLQPFHRHRDRRAQLLREERDTQLLDEPPDVLELRVDAA